MKTREKAEQTPQAFITLRAMVPAIIVLAVSLFATALSVMAQRAAILSGERSRFIIAQQAVSDAISDVMQTYVGVMRAGVGLYDAKRDVSAAEWMKFIAAMNLAQEFPGIQGVGFSEVIGKAQPDGGDLDIPAGQMRTAIRFLAPDDWRNQRAIGFDMYAEPVRRIAMAAARDSGTAVMTGAVTLLQETEQQRGVLIYLPVYGGPDALLTETDRRRRLRGFVYSAFRMNDLMSLSLARRDQEMLRNIRLRIFDGAQGETAPLLFDSAPPASAPAGASAAAPMFEASEKLVIAGRIWTVNVQSLPVFEQKIDWSRLAMQLAGGLVISILMAAIVAGLSMARKRSLDDAALLSAEVDDRKRAEQQAHLANRELIHRVKNTLAIVNAIASQTARHSPNMNEFMRAFRERLGALGRVHDLLRPDVAGDPSFRKLVVETLSAYRPTDSQALQIEGPEISVARDDAVLLSLFLNELATNAIKYGAWSASRGSVHVTWRIETPADQPASLVVDWKERNGPKISVPGRTGFGTNVMRFAVERSLRGAITLNYPETGAEHEIRLPWGKTVNPQAPFGQIPNKSI